MLRKCVVGSIDSGSQGDPVSAVVVVGVYVVRSHFWKIFWFLVDKLSRARVRDDSGNVESAARSSSMRNRCRRRAYPACAETRQKRGSGVRCGCGSHGCQAIDRDKSRLTEIIEGEKVDTARKSPVRGWP